MSLLLKQLFSLLRAGIWTHFTPDRTLFAQPTDWNALYLLARQQTVSAIVWDGIQKLPNELFPPQKLRMKWLGLVVQIERSNQIMNQTLDEITSIFNEHGLHPILIKGQSVAANYPNPLHRECGDIDLLFLQNEYERSIEIGKKINTGHSHESRKHFAFTYKGIPIENHRFLITLYDLSQQKKLDNKTQLLDLNNLPELALSHGTIKELPHELSTHFVFIHLYHHFMVRGLGLRQVCDWTLLLEKQPIKQYIPYKPLIYWQIFGDMAVQYLGLDSSKLIHHRTFSHRTNWLLQQIIKDGNFGKNNQSHFKYRGNGFYLQKIISLFHKLYRYPRFIALSPLQSIPIIFRYLSQTIYITLLKQNN